MNYLESFFGLNLDLRSSLMGAAILAIGTYIYRKLSTKIIKGAKWVIDGVLFNLYPLMTRTASSTITLGQYCRFQLEGENKFLIVPGAKDISLNIDEMFVPLALEKGGDAVLYNHNTLLSQGNRFRIIGDPGSGKSSIAKKIFREQCKNNDKIMPRRDSRFPILIELRTVPFPVKMSESKLGEWLYNYIIDELNRFRLYDIDNCFSAYAETSGLLIVLDGLDEVLTDKYPVAEAAINTLSRKLEKLSPNNIIILTMRIQFHQQIRGGFQRTFPLVFSLVPFSPTDIFEFLQRWKFDHADKTNKVLKIYTDLADRPTLREMCTNPLILSMYVAQEQSAGHPAAPESRTEFYSRVVEELLIRRRATQIGPQQGQLAMRTRREQILGRIAFEHLIDVQQAPNLIRWELGLSIAQDVLKMNRDEAERELRFISKETGLVTEEKIGQTFRFIHLTICEYMAALHATQERAHGWNELLDCHRSFQEKSPASRSRLVEVLPFTCALMARHLQPAAITDLEKIGDDRLLALAFLESKAYDHLSWKGFVTRRANELLDTISEARESGWLRDLHLFTVVCSDASRSNPGDDFSMPIQSFFEKLSSREDDTVYHLIESYAAQDAVAAFHVAGLCKIDILQRLPHVVVRNCDQPAFLGIVLQQAYKEPQRLESWSHALAEGLLRSAAVSGELARSDAVLWNEKVKTIPIDRRWNCDALPRNPAIDCLSCACYYGVPDTELHPLLCCYKNIRPPGGRMVFKYSMFINVGFGATLVLFLIALGVMFEEAFSHNSPVVFLAMAVMAGLSAIILELAFFYKQFAARQYRRLIDPRGYRERPAGGESGLSGLFGWWRLTFSPKEREQLAKMGALRNHKSN